MTYWLINLHARPVAIFNYIAILYLDLLAAESLVVLISAVFPIFVVSLAVLFNYGSFDPFAAIDLGYLSKGVDPRRC